MKTITLSEIELLKTIIANRKARMERIMNRVAEITANIQNMDENQLLDAKDEIHALTDEVSEHLAFIRKTEPVIARFYRPAYRAA